MRIFLTLLFTFLIHFSQAQNRLIGEVKNEKNISIQGATISLLTADGIILLFSITDSKGNYELNLSDELLKLPLMISVKNIGYESSSQPFQIERMVYNFILKESATLLEAVIVNPPIQIKGDTIIYKVDAFAVVEDRSILDVLKRMPGISVEESGKIYFNGKEIANLYFQGDELMDGRYNAATRVVKKEMIKNVEVIQNHQPIKVLQNKKNSDAVSLNFILEDENSWKLSTNSDLSIGVPNLFAIEFNAIILNKKLKTINTIQSNNAGIDYKNNMDRQANLPALSNSKGSSFLSTGTVGDPDVPKKYYYFNQSNLGNLNISYNTKGGNQLKTNLIFYSDRHRLHYKNQTSIYTAHDTIHFVENQISNNSINSLSGSFTYTANKQNYYLYNRTSLDLESIQRKNSLFRQEDGFNQQLQNKPFELKNTFIYNPQIKQKAILGFEWSSIYSNKREYLLIDEGLYPEILNEGILYQQVLQRVQLPHLSNDISIDFLINSYSFRQNYSLRIKNDHKNLSSTLFTEQDNHIWNESNTNMNDLKWMNQTTSLAAEYTWVKKNKLELSGLLPFTHQYIQYEQPSFLMKENPKRLWFNPQLAFKWFINTKQELLLNAGIKNELTDIHSIYRGAILTNYRNIQANNATLQESFNKNAVIKYRFKKPIQMLFINASLSYLNQENSSILSYVLDDQVQKTILLPIKNEQTSISFALGINKYSYFLKSNVSFNSSISNNETEQYINHVLIPIKLHSFNNSIGLDTRLFNRIQFNYISSFIYSQMRMSSALDVSSLHRIDQTIKIGLHLFKSIDLTGEFRSSFNENNFGQNNHYIFSDAKIRYHVKKLKADIEISANNLANVKTYETYSMQSGYSSKSLYELRGRMLMIKMSVMF